jgi:hypothetical protein
MDPVERYYTYGGDFSHRGPDNAVKRCCQRGLHHLINGCELTSLELNKHMSDLNILLPATLVPMTSPLVLDANIPVRFTLSNTSREPVTFRTFKAAAIPAALGWHHSLEAYNLSALIAHSLVTATVFSSSGEQVTNCGPTPWINPLFGTVTLPPGETYSLDFNLAEFFQIDRADRYTVVVGFSDGDVSAAATAEIVVLSREGSTP